MADELEEGEIQEDVAVTDQRNSPQSTARKVYLRVPSPPPSPVLSSVRPKKKKRKLTPPAATETKPGTQQTAGQKVLDQIYGQQGRAEVQIQALSSTTIRLPDVVGLVLWVLADGSNTRWVFIKNKALVQKVVMVAVPGIDADLFQEKKAGLPNMHTLLGPATKLQAKNATVRPGQTVSALFAVPMRKKRKREVAEEKQAGKRRRAPFPPSHYAMRLEQMEAHNFPLPEVSESGEMRCPEGYIATQPSGAAGAVSVPSERMVALDCEMCQTTAGLEVTRVTLIDEMCQVLLDELVLPHNPITDYVTRYSGITAAMMAGVTTRLADVQQRFLELVSAETLLVGHSLENDLLCLKIIHANILDTAVLFPHPRGPPYRSALRIITEKFLKRQIQNGSHDSIADARAAMELAQLKVKNGPSFGLGTTDEAFEKLMDVLGESNRRCTLVDRQDMLNRHVTGSAAAVVSTSDADALAKAIREAQNPAINFLWTQLRDLSTFFEERAQWRRQTAIRAVEDDKQVERLLATIDRQIGELHRALPPNTLLLVVTCQGDTAECRRLQEQKFRRQQGLDGLPPWSTDCEAEFARILAGATRALCFCSVKQ
ncbi:hypothetical protein WJX72_011714 [[Myrmecia] bisecta]|uniref:Exonuclease domain-containing protein n=1 Tax=[Myrmecia] bisecta TaxID=41462 RepID=A0AAW1QH20_9CHLO